MESSDSTPRPEDYDVLEKIGHGSFGIIRRVRRKTDGFICCRKEINYLKMSQKEREQLHAEFQCLSALRHPNIVAYYHREHLRDTQELHLYMEYCGNGDLGRIIKDLASKGQRASEQFVWSIFGQLASALYRCHYGIDPPSPNDSTALPEKAPVGSICIMHRDLKPENVFLGENNSVKLGDFGLSKMIKSQDFASTYVGTPYYMSPEICAAERYTLKSDIWALGCIVYELCMRNPPFDARTHYELVRKIKESDPAPLPASYSKDLKNAINACLMKSPDSRPSTHDLMHIPQIRITRREMEVAEMQRKYKQKQVMLETKEKRLNDMIANMEAERKTITHDIDSRLRREWETKAQLEISRHINIEIDKLQRQFEIEVQARVEAEIRKRSSIGSQNSTPITRAVTPEPKSRPSLTEALVNGAADGGDAPVGLNKRNVHTPLKRAQTMYAGMNHETSGDVEMVSPSPIAISSLSLSPRRNGTTKPPSNNPNIFRLARPGARDGSGNWEMPQDLSGLDSDDDEAPASPTPAVRAVKHPFNSKNRPVLMSQKSGLNKPLSIPVLQGKGSNPELSRLSPTRRLSKIPSASTLGSHKLSSGSSSGSDGGSAANKASPTRNRKLFGHNHTQSEVPGDSRSLKLFTNHHSQADTSNDVRSGKSTAKTIVRGRTLVELQQARAGGRPVSAVFPSSATSVPSSGSSVDSSATIPGVENVNVSPKRRHRARLEGDTGRRSSDPTVWDPAVDEMPSPFLTRTRQVRT